MGVMRATRKLHARPPSALHLQLSREGEIGERIVTVSWEHLPGALTLLLDMGEFDLVVEVGSRVLRSRQIVNSRRDILLAIAIAHCGLAQETLDGGDRVALGCGRLEEALSVLRSAGEPPLAPHLIAEVKRACAPLTHSRHSCYPS